MDSAKIAELLKRYPAKVLDSGNLRLPPARLSYPNIFEKSKPRGKIKEEKYTGTFLFPKGCDLRPVVQYFVQTGIATGFTQPVMQAMAKERIQEQAKKADKTKGYEAGAYFIHAKSDYQPTALDLAGRDLMDPRSLYPGVWVIGLINAYRYEQPTAGKSWGLQSVVKIADDEPFGGVATDPREDLGDILDASADAGALFGDSKPNGSAGSEADIFG